MTLSYFKFKIHKTGDDINRYVSYVFLISIQCVSFCVLTHIVLNQRIAE